MDRARSSSGERGGGPRRSKSHAGPARDVVLVLLLAVTAGLLTLAWIRFDTSEDALAPATVARADVALESEPLALDARGAVDAPAIIDTRRVEEIPPDAQEAALEFVVPVKVLVFDSAKGFTSVAGLRVELAFAMAGDELAATALAEARTEADGIARFEIPAVHFAASRARRVWPAVVARVRELGWQSQYATRELPSSNRALELSISTAPGGTIVGRVVDADAVGVPEASITGEYDTRPGPVWRATSRSRADGSFELHLVQPAPHDIHATADHVGTAMLAALDVRFTDPPQEIELRLVGPGRLRGRVRDTSGAAAAGLRLRIEHTQSGLAGRLEGLLLAKPGEASTGPSGVGLTSARVTTDAEGRFDVTGLCRDRYRIHVSAGTPREEASRLLTNTPVEADGIELDLVYERPHLVVRVVDATGGKRESPFAISAEFATEIEARIATHNASRDGWPDRASLRVSPVDAVDPELDVLAAVRGVALDDGRFVFEIAGGRAYDVSLEGGQLAFATRRVRAPEDARRIDVELVAETQSTGRVLLDVRDVDGEPLEETVRVRLEDPRTGARVLELDEGPAVRTPWPPGFEAPVGRWRLVVEGAPRSRGHPPRLADAVGRGRAEQIVHVLANETTPVTARFPIGARLRVTARGSVAPVPTTLVDDPDGRDIASSWVLTPSGQMSRQLAASAVRTWLIQPVRAPVPVWFSVDLGQGVVTRSESFELGATGLSQVVPAGEFMLEARLPDGRVVRTPVVLVDGETTDVEIEFAAFEAR